MLYRYFVSKRGYTFTEVMIVVVVLGILTAVAVPLFALSVDTYKKKDCENQRIVVNGMILGVLVGEYDGGAPQYGLLDDSGCVSANPNGELIIPFSAKSYTVDLKGVSFYEYNLQAEKDGLPEAEVVTRTADHICQEIQYNGVDVPSFKLVPYGIIINNKAQDEYVFTIGDLRGGHWRQHEVYKNVEDSNLPNREYDDFTSEFYFLKNRSLIHTPFYLYINNQSLPSGYSIPLDGSQKTSYETKVIKTILEDFPICPFSDVDSGEIYFYYILQNGDVVCPHCDENVTLRETDP